MAEEKPNLYRDALGAHRTEVSEAIDFSLTPPSGYGHPCTAICQTVADGAWESKAADAWVEEIDGLGSSVRSSFNNYYLDVSDAYAGEPATVEVPGVHDWKATWGGE